MRKNYICIHDYNIIIYGFKSKRPYQAKGMTMQQFAEMLE